MNIRQLQRKLRVIFSGIGLFWYSLFFALPGLHADIFTPTDSYRQAAANIIIDGNGSDWAGFPATVQNPRNHPNGDASLDIQSVSIAVRDNDLLIMMKTWGPPTHDDGRYCLDIDLLGDETQDIQIAANPSGTSFFRAFQDALPFKDTMDSKALQIVVGNVVEIHISYDALRPLLGAAQQTLFQPGQMKKWNTVHAGTWTPTQTDNAPPVGAYRLSVDPAWLALPITGVPVPQLAAFDEVMTNFMNQHQLFAGMLGIMRQGSVVFSHGYGWADPHHVYPNGPATPMQMGSISKLIALTAAKQLARDGILDLNATVGSILGLNPPNGTVLDSRMANITSQQLIDHTSGLVNGSPSCRPMAALLGLDRDPTAFDWWNWAIGYSILLSDPGSTNNYSNVGYLVLGAVIEKVAGTNYLNYLTSKIVPPKMPTLNTGHSRESARDPREIWYDDSGLATDDFDLSDSNLVRYVNGGICEEPDFGNATMVASAPDLLQFFQKWWINGTPRDNSSPTYSLSPINTNASYGQLTLLRMSARSNAALAS